METIDTDFIHITILDERTVLVEALDGVEINLEKSRLANNLIKERMGGNYGMIIYRKADYSIVPVDVYKVLNDIETLKAIAIVVPKARNFLPIQTEKTLFRGELEPFKTIKDACEWLEGLNF